jgi:hypothetical protein
VSDYRVVRPFAWEGQLYNPGRPDPAPEQSGRGTDHPRVAVAELLHGRDDAHRDTRAAAEPELARRVEVSPLARVCRHGEIVPAGGSCSRCQAEKRGRSRRRGSTSTRGYGSAHQSLRKRLAPLVASGQVRCARCGKVILPGTPWDLGHTGDRTGYHGAEHAGCNRGASRMGGRIGA